MDKARTSPYKFYQYWLNASDEDAENYIKIFTFLSREEIEDLIAEHRENPHMRLLQKRIAEEVTLLVHSQEDLDNAQRASQILFGKSTSEDLLKLDEATFLDVLKGCHKPNCLVIYSRKDWTLLLRLLEKEIS